MYVVGSKKKKFTLLPNGKIMVIGGNINYDTAFATHLNIFETGFGQKLFESCRADIAEFLGKQIKEIGNFIRNTKFDMAGIKFENDNIARYRKIRRWLYKVLNDYQKAQMDDYLKQQYFNKQKPTIQQANREPFFKPTFNLNKIGKKSIMSK